MSAARPLRGSFQQLLLLAFVLIALLAFGIMAIDARALVWLIPVGLPLLLAVPLAVLSSHIGLGKAMRQQGFPLIPEERWSPKVLRRAWLHAHRLAAA